MVLVADILIALVCSPRSRPGRGLALSPLTTPFLSNGTVIKLEMNPEAGRPTRTMTGSSIQGLRAFQPNAFGPEPPSHFLVSNTGGRIFGDQWIVLVAVVLVMYSIQIIKEVSPSN